MLGRIGVSDGEADPALRAEPRHWFEDIAAHARGAYLRYSFTKGTAQEVDFLVDALGLAPGMRVLDVGCGPGRHSLELARRGIEAHGIDISQSFVDLATEAGVEGATFERLDARSLRFDGEFDAAISLCQGAFGLLGGTDDGAVLAGMARAVRSGGTVCVSAFSAYFQVRWLEDTDSFDAATGVNHERATVKDEAGADAEFDLWTTCFTPRELRLLAERAGLSVRHVWSVTPGAYAAAAPSIDTPEFLLVATVP
ncbi:MAG TPA: methyltransferase domain-containing protein [Acidimicrobiales bacterium]|nr:methyltransferase domain-containing protein [Acidimicrobiales bacterium]